MPRSKKSELAMAQEAAALWEANQAGNQTKAYAARFLAQTSLPYNEPPPDTNVWSRRNGNVELVLTPRFSTDGRNGSKGTPEFPYGSYPRLFLTWLSTQAVLTQDPVVDLGPSQRQFLLELGLGTSNGKTGPAARFRMQALRLLESSLTIRSTSATHDSGLRFFIATEWDLYWGRPGPDGQTALLPSKIQLSREFFDYLKGAPVPIDWNIMRFLQGAPMSMDIYVWLTHRFSWLQAPTTVPWLSLKNQLGSQFADDPTGLRNFKAKVNTALGKVLAVYPEANVTSTGTGLQLAPSLTSVPLRGTRGLRSTG